MNNITYYIFLIIHLIICFLLVYGWTIKSKLWLEFLIMASIYIQSMYGLFNGCVCTRLERKYDKWNKIRKNSIMDPIVNFLNISKNRSNIDYVTGLFVNFGLVNTILIRYLFL